MNIAGGDWRFFFPENVVNFSGIPSAWDASLNTGIGQPELNTLWITGYLYFTSLLSNIGFSWNAISLICWIIPPLITGSISMFFLYRHVWRGKYYFALISSLIYISNTYFLLIFSGGQLGVTFSYSLVPLVVLRFLKNTKVPNLYNSIFFGLVISLQVLFDPRIAAITIFVLAGLLLVTNVKNVIKGWKYTIFIPLLFAGAVHAYWIIPILVFYSGITINPAIGLKVSDLSFFSFATLENSISLLHPNWPENLFGKVYFMKPEFIVLPTLAFVSLLIKKNKKIKTIFVVALVSLIFIFLAKGVNEPFGILYELALKHIPGFSVFRDPTKFYIPVALCYALLIPVSLGFIAGYITKFKRLRKNAEVTVAVLFIAFWFVLLSPLFQGQVNGIFRLRTVSSDYLSYKNFITQQPEFFRALWIPQIQRFGFFSNNHPAIGRGEIFHDKSLKGMLKELTNPKMQDKLSSLSVKYVIVPYDSEAEIFVSDNKFDKKHYDLVVATLSKVPWLTLDRTFGQIIVFKTTNYNSHFKLNNELFSERIRVDKSKPTEYQLSIQGKKGDILVFSESFDRNWIVTTPFGVLKSKEHKGLNSFVIARDGRYNVEIIYQPQRLVDVLFLISLCTIGGMVAYLVFSLIGNKKYDKAG